MEWKFSEEQVDYQNVLRGWLQQTAPMDQVRRWLGTDDEPADPGDFERRLSAAGLAGVGVPEALGGQGGGIIELALTGEEFARAGVPCSAWLATVLALPALDSRPDLAEQALDSAPLAWLISAENIPDLRTVELANVEADGRLSGSFTRALGADRAARLLVVAEVDGRAQVHVVDTEADGVRVAPRRLLDASRSVADVTLDGVRSQPLDVDAAQCLERVAEIAAVLTAADSLGAMERMLDLAVEYSGQRHQFGKPIGSFQAIKHAAASILVEVEAGRTGVFYAAASVDSAHEDRAMHVAAIKAQVTAGGAVTADTALTIHGAIGYTWEHDLHLYYKRARLNEHLFGPPAEWNERLANRLHLV
ncbi:acyl-CoA dehydrogenase [Nocardioides seonyuensis]|uniref:Acyl-CoA dehydrogenase n=1 Tax=Nocardioides seonyuensis TaxID=2518371 RepID=A0A4P7II74_9ACTN|nr:acyl-CoA dehydrogenase family protein [Nocardioides seonyuensis]QBX55927.1 acyl-CoA dehydrogenase [Nocardioides seonyuensis]